MSVSTSFVISVYVTSSYVIWVNVSTLPLSAWQYYAMQIKSVFKSALMCVFTLCIASVEAFLNGGVDIDIIDNIGEKVLQILTPVLLMVFISAPTLSKALTDAMQRWLHNVVVFDRSDK